MKFDEAMAEIFSTYNHDKDHEPRIQSEIEGTAIIMHQASDYFDTVFSKSSNDFQRKHIAKIGATCIRLLQQIY